MNTDALFDLITAHGSLLALSRHLLGDEWTAARYDTIRRMVAAGKITGWPAAIVKKELELEELRARVAAIAKETAQLHALPAEAAEDSSYLDADIDDLTSLVETVKTLAKSLGFELPPVKWVAKKPESAADE